MSKDLFSRQAFTHNGITVVLEIDFEKKTVSFVDRKGDGHYEHKKWVFADRTQEYLGGWVRILKAMEFAIKEADKLLGELDKRNEGKFASMLMELKSPTLKNIKANPKEQL